MAGARRQNGGGIEIVDPAGFAISLKQFVDCVARGCFHSQVCDGIGSNENDSLKSSIRFKF